jgi:glutathione S-transferase
MHTSYDNYALDGYQEEAHRQRMKLYFNPLACSLASRITVFELELPVELIEVDPPTKRLLDSGEDYRAINPLGLVPALRLDSGELLTENAVILPYLADLRPAAGLAPPPDAGLPRLRMNQWLSYVGTELHKAIYMTLLDRKAPDAVKEYVLTRADSRLGHVAAHLDRQEYVLDRFSVADAYLFTVLNWSQVTPIDLARWPSLAAYVARIRARPAVKRALADELPMYTRELSRSGLPMPQRTPPPAR